MKDRIAIANSVMWAAAVIAGALLKAPTLLTLVLLPGLAVCSLLVSSRRCT